MLPLQRRNSRLEQDSWPGWYNHYEKSHLFNSGQKTYCLHKHLLWMVSMTTYKDCTWHIVICVLWRTIQQILFPLVTFKGLLWLFLMTVQPKMIILVIPYIFLQSHASFQILLFCIKCKVFALFLKHGFFHFYKICKINLLSRDSKVDHLPLKTNKTKW